MKALVSTGNQDTLIEFADIEDPRPAANEALVRIAAVSINRGQANVLRLSEPGWCPGWDLAGEVAAPAKDGTGPSAGTRIVGWVPTNAWAEFVSVPTSSLAPIPEAVDLAVAATLPVAGITALRTLQFGGEIDGKNVLIVGGAGGVGSFAVQIAKSKGAIVTATAHGAERQAYVQSLGAETVVNGAEDAQDEYDLILESAGGISLAESLRKVKPGGVVVSFGNSSKQETTLNIVDFYRRNRASLHAFALVAPGESSAMGADLESLLRLFQDGDIAETQVLQRPWTEACEAIGDLEARAVIGKSVLTL